MAAGSRAGRAERSQAAIPPMPDSSQPGRTMATSVPSSGSATSRSTSAITAATPVALSLAPGTVSPVRDLERERASRAPAPRGQARARGGDRQRQRPSPARASSENGGRPSRDAPAGQARVPHQPGVGGIVVRHEHERPTALAPRGQPRDHVGALPRRQQPPQPLRPARQLELERQQRRRGRSASGQRGRAVKGVCVAEGVLVAKRLGADVLCSGIAKPSPRTTPRTRARPALAERRLIAASASTSARSVTLGASPPARP